MDSETRNTLLAKLVDAVRREVDAVQRLKTHAANIEQVRAVLGNPYFYSGLSPDDSESGARFTGYESHDPALQVYRDLQVAAREVASIRNQLREAGAETD
jgi:hypothetical protein